MHQYLKIKEHQTHNISGFCPLDLYASNNIRRTKAFQELLKNPQNNLKIYYDGVLCFANSMSDQDSKDNLTQYIRNTFPGASTNEIIEELTRVFVSILGKEVVLENLRKTQLLDHYDIEFIEWLHNILLRMAHKQNEFDFENNLLELSPNEIVKLKSTTGRETITTREAIGYIRDFMISATVKDCSIMITIGNITHESEINLSTLNTVTDNISNNIYVYKISVIDLDPKPLLNLSYYYDLDQKLVHQYLNCLVYNIASSKNCVDYYQTIVKI